MRAISTSIRPTSADACSHSWPPSSAALRRRRAAACCSSSASRVAGVVSRALVVLVVVGHGSSVRVRGKRNARARARARALGPQRSRTTRTSIPGATGPSRRTRAYQRASSGRTLWLIRAMRPSTNHCAWVAHGAAYCVSSSSGPALSVVAGAELEPVAFVRALPVDAEQREVLAVRARERLVAVGAHALDRLLRVQADRRRSGRRGRPACRGRRRRAPSSRIDRRRRPAASGTPPRFRLTDATIAARPGSIERRSAHITSVS